MAYKMAHPDSTVEIEVDGGSVAVYESQGWETSPSANPPAVGEEKSSKK